MQTASFDNPTLKGSQYRSTHKLAVIGVLGDRAPEVSSRGSRFYNVDRWTVRVFVREMCKWAHENPECVPTRTEIAAWADAANRERVPRREIVIANTPNKLQLRTAMALTGGAYHEAFHTYYSCLRPLKVEEMARMVLPRWAKVPDWSRYYGLLQEWNNIVEDVRIERLGRIEFEGTLTKLQDLQDFILAQEAKGLENMRAHGGNNAGRGALSIITATFRDVGLGYNTQAQRDALAKYRAENAAAVQFVIGAGKGNPGPLTGLLKEAIALPATDDIGCVRVAMDVIGILYNESSEQDPANDPNNQEHQPGEGQKTACPACGAKGSKLVIRPKSDGRGGKVKGVGVMTCTVCGHQEEIQLQAGQKGGKGQKQDPEDTPKFEGFDPEDQPQQGGGGGQQDDSDDAEGQQSQGGDGGGQSQQGDDSDESDGQQGGGSGDPQDGDDDGDSQGGGSSDESDEDGDEDQDGSGDDGDDDADDGHAGNDWSQDGDDDGDNDNCNDPNADDGDDVTDGPLDEQGSGQPQQNQANTDKDATGEQGAEGGGHNYEEGNVEGNDWSKLADDALDGADEGSGLKDNNSALEEAVNAESDDEERHEGGVKRGERAWRPHDPALDEFVFVEPSRAGKDHDREQADRLYASVKDEASFLRSRLRQIVKALEMSTVVHGTRKGRRLSSRFLVDSRVTLMGKEQPKRAYKQVDEAQDTSLSAAVVIDESGSMSGALKDATRVLCAITEPLDALGCPVQVSGFRDGSYHARGGRYYDGPDGEYHRYGGIVHDIFKAFDEPLRSVKWRFANTRATGGTPMADGVQFALDALSARNEGHRVMFVITDGQPNGGHAEIIRRQVRLAKDAGIHIIGVGLGYGAEYVQNVFPDSVWTANIRDMPKALIAKLNELVDVRASKRGKRVKAG
jgi:hypothetical protein